MTQDKAKLQRCETDRMIFITERIITCQSPLLIGREEALGPKKYTKNRRHVTQHLDKPFS